jgi:predicted transcriptional regulator
VLSPAQIAARLDDHFSVLGPGRRGAPSRQQTMRQAIDWSYALLGPAERALFARLAVFVGTFDLDAAELVGSGDDVGDATVLEVLGRLVDRSMVSCSETAGVMRYRLLEPLRQYGLQLLDEDRLELLRARHAAYLVGLAERTETARADGDDLGALRVVDWSFDDIRAAYTWAIRTGRFDVAAELTAPLYAEAQVRQRREVVERARVVLDNAAGLPNDLVGWMTVITAWGDTWADRRIDAINAFEAAADLFERADDPHAAATARGMACGALLFEGRLDAAAAVSQRAFEALPEGDLRGLFCLAFNRTLGVFRGDPEPELRAALADVDGVLASAERAGSHVLMGFARGRQDRRTARGRRPPSARSLRLRTRRGQLDAHPLLDALRGRRPHRAGTLRRRSGRPWAHRSDATDAAVAPRARPARVGPPSTRRLCRAGHPRGRTSARCRDDHAADRDLGHRHAVSRLVVRRPPRTSGPKDQPQ